MNVRFAWVLCSVLAATASTLPAGSRYAWVYGVTDSLNVAQTMKAWGAVPLGGVFLSLNTRRLEPTANGGSASYTTKVVELLDSCAIRGIAVHAMILEDGVFTYPTYHDPALTRMKAFAEFVDRFPKFKNAPLAGIHLDIEPHALSDWQAAASWPAKNDLMIQFDTLLSRLDSLVHGRNGQAGIMPWAILSAAIGYFYDSRAATGDLPAGAPQILSKYLDLLVPMAYLDGAIWDSASLAKKIATEWSYGKGEVAAGPTVIGIRASRFAGLSDRFVFESAMVDSAKGDPNFKGFAYFDWQDLSTTASVLHRQPIPIREIPEEMFLGTTGWILRPRVGRDKVLRRVLPVDADNQGINGHH